MTKEQVKIELKPLFEQLKKLEDKFGVDTRIVETEAARHKLSYDKDENWRMEDGCRSNNIIVDIRLIHDAKTNSPGLSPVGSDCLSPCRNTAG